MWEPFTEEARRCMVLATEEAQKIGNSFIAPEHILLGAFGQEQSNAAKALAAASATYASAFEAARANLAAYAGGPSHEMGFTPRARNVISGAFGEARELGHTFIAVEHLVLAIIREGQSSSENFLATLHVDEALLRERLIAALPPKTSRENAESTAPFTRFDHVQIAMPAGGEERARAFYAGMLGMRETPKPPELAARGGAWFESGNVRLHLGVDDDFHAAAKAHPALRCRDYRALLERLSQNGIAVQPAPDPLPDGSAHCYMADPFGNRIELIE